MRSKFSDKNYPHWCWTFKIGSFRDLVTFKGGQTIRNLVEKEKLFVFISETKNSKSGKIEFSENPKAKGNILLLHLAIVFISLPLFLRTYQWNLEISELPPLHNVDFQSSQKILIFMMTESLISIDKQDQTRVGEAALSRLYDLLRPLARTKSL